MNEFKYDLLGVFASRWNAPLSDNIRLISALWLTLSFNFEITSSLFSGESAGIRPTWFGVYLKVEISLLLSLAS